MMSISPYTPSPVPEQPLAAPSQPASANEVWSGEAGATTPSYPGETTEPTWNANAGGTDGSGGMPPILPPDYYGMGPARRRRRPRWRSMLVAGALVLTLAGGIGIGTAVAEHVGGTSVGGNTTLSVPTNVSTLQATLEKVAAAAEPSVVEVTSTGASGEAIGSGDIITSNGYIVTNDHVVDGFSSFTVTLQNGSTLQARLVGTDPANDLAVLKVSANNLKPITFADSSKVTVGEYVVAIGTPLGQRETATFGNVSAVNRTESESPSGPATLLTGLIQTSAPITNGNSGGALVNLQGQLIGMPTLGATNQSGSSSGTTSTVAFAIPSNQIKSIAQSIIDTGQAPTSTQGFLGIQGEDVTPYVAAQNGLSTQSGVLVAGFANDAAGQSPAQAAGLQSGDVIVAVNGQTISDSTDLATAVATQRAGTKVHVTVVRGTGQTTITITLGARPS